jgi:predicted acetyltransferase
VLLEENRIISHVAVPSKDIEHEGQTYRAFGLSEVMTAPSHRRQGFGLQLVKEATSYIESNNPDIGIFTCQPALVSFYTQGGWEHIDNTNVIGGTRQKPFRSDALGLSTMMRFFSEKAQQNRSAFEGADVYLELGENMLW